MSEGSRNVNFAQEVKPGRYPVISEAIGNEHR